jgi:general secretion pathway protein M
MNAYLERFRAWWSGLAERERRVLGSGAAVLAVILLYLAVWEPLAGARRDRETALSEARALAVLLETLAAEAQRGHGPGGPTAGAGQSLLAVVDQSRKASALTKPPTRLQPEGEGMVRIWLEDVPFDALVRWLHDLQTRYGVRVDNADIERESAVGLVNARLTLMRG